MCSSDLKSVSGKEFCKIVVKNGWVLQRVTGSHHIYAIQLNLLLPEFVQLVGKNSVSVSTRRALADQYMAWSDL